jgi:hypothetical protein
MVWSFGLGAQKASAQDGHDEVADVQMLAGAMSRMEELCQDLLDPSKVCSARIQRVR